MNILEIDDEIRDLIDTYHCWLRAIARLSLHDEEGLETICNALIDQARDPQEAELAQAVLRYAREI
jgi:hypothetical protein